MVNGHDDLPTLTEEKMYLKEKVEAIRKEDLVPDNDHGTVNRLALAQRMSEEEFAAAEKKLKLKLDLRLMVMITFIYILNYLDRNNIAAVKVAGIEQSLGLSSGQYSTAVALLFVGYTLMQIPSNMFLAQLRPSWYLPACMAIWGTISACTGVVKSSGGLYAARFMLGVVEAAYFPGSLFLISCWYKRSEMGTRCAILYSGSQVGGAVSGLIAAGITDGLDGALGMPAWRWIFIIEGSITVFVALTCIFILPDYPTNTRWLCPTERAVAEWRIIKDAGQVDEDEGSWKSGFIVAIGDWRTYVFAIMLMCVLVTTAAQNFFPTIVATLGYGRIETLGLTAPPYIFGAIVMILNNLSADRCKNASFHIIWLLLVAIAGFVIIAATLDRGARYFAMFLIIAGGHGTNAVVYAWTSKTLLRPRMKRAAVVAIVNTVGNTAQIWTAYLYPNQDAPRYVLAMSVNAGFAMAAILLVIFMRIVLRRANKSLADGEDISKVMMGGVQTEISGLSEEERNKRRGSFRFIT